MFDININVSENFVTVLLKGGYAAHDNEGASAFFLHYRNLNSENVDFHLSKTQINDEMQLR